MDHDAFLADHINDFRAIPGCELHVFSGANHYLPFEDAAAVAVVVNAFHERVARRALLTAAAVGNQ